MCWHKWWWNSYYARGLLPLKSVWTGAACPTGSKYHGVLRWESNIYSAIWALSYSLHLFQVWDHLSWIRSSPNSTMHFRKGLLELYTIALLFPSPYFKHLLRHSTVTLAFLITTLHSWFTVILWPTGAHSYFQLLSHFQLMNVQSAAEACIISYILADFDFCLISYSSKSSGYFSLKCDVISVLIRVWFSALVKLLT